MSTCACVNNPVCPAYTEKVSSAVGDVPLKALSALNVNCRDIVVLTTFAKTAPRKSSSLYASGISNTAETSAVSPAAMLGSAMNTLRVAGGVLNICETLVCVSPPADNTMVLSGCSLNNHHKVCDV